MKHTVFALDLAKSIFQRAVLLHAKRRKNPGALRQWALRLEKTRGHNIATVGLANRLARIAWAVWLRDRDYRERCLTN